MKYNERVAALAEMAAALNDRQRSRIGDPRKQQYKVAVHFHGVKDALDFAKHLAQLGVQPTTTITHEKMFGTPSGATVNVYNVGAQRRLLSLVGSELHEERRNQLEELVLAREPIPDDILKNIWVSARKGRRPRQIAERMNELGIIAGMGGVRWTAKKINDALAEYERRHGSDKVAA